MAKACLYMQVWFDLTNNAFILMDMKLGSVQKGCLVFDTINYHDLASCNAPLSGFDDDVTSDQGPRMFKQMLVKVSSLICTPFAALQGTLPAFPI